MAVPRWRPGTEVRAVLRDGAEPWVAVGHRLGIVELLPTEHEDDVVGHLGPGRPRPGLGPAERAGG